MNLYWMVNPARTCLTSKAKKEDVEALAILTADIDPRKDEDAADARAAAIAKLEAYRFILKKMGSTSALCVPICQVGPAILSSRKSLVSVPLVI